MTDSAAALLQLDQAVRQQVDATLELIRLQRAALKQWFGMKALRERWEVSEAQVVALLQHHVGYQGEVGVRLRVELDDVLLIDRVLHEAQEAKRHARRLPRNATKGLACAV